MLASTRILTRARGQVRVGPTPERVVEEVLSEQPVEIEYKVKTRRDRNC